MMQRIKRSFIGAATGTSSTVGLAQAAVLRRGADCERMAIPGVVSVSPTAWQGGNKTRHAGRKVRDRRPRSKRKRAGVPVGVIASLGVHILGLEEDSNAVTATDDLQVLRHVSRIG